MFEKNLLFVLGSLKFILIFCYRIYQNQILKLFLFIFDLLIFTNLFVLIHKFNIVNFRTFNEIKFSKGLYNNFQNEFNFDFYCAFYRYWLHAL